MRKKIDSYLGFAVKSRNLICGYNTCVAAMNKGKIKLLLVAEDISQNTEEKILRAAEKKRVLCRRYGAVSELSRITGEENAGIFGIIDENFANVILKEIEKSETEKKEVF